MKPTFYNLHGRAFRHYQPNADHFCLDLRDDHGQWHCVAYGTDAEVRRAVIDAICLPLDPARTYTAVILGRFSISECIAHADTLRGHGFRFTDATLRRPPCWQKDGCTIAALTAARALAASLGLRYERRDDQPPENTPHD